MRELLTHRLSIAGIHALCAQAQACEQTMNLLYTLSLDPDSRVSRQALWALCHLDSSCAGWLCTLHDELVERAMAEHDTTRLRLLLSLLVRQPFSADCLRGDFIDFCMARITDCGYPYAIRALCIRLSYAQMRHHRPLLRELLVALDQLGQQQLSPGLVSVRRQVMAQIARTLPRGMM